MSNGNSPELGILFPVSGQFRAGSCRGSSPAVLAAGPLCAGGEPLRRATPSRLSGAPEKELPTSPLKKAVVVGGAGFEPATTGV